MIQYDSRKVKPGDTFVAIPGAKFDGADFIPQAIANGAKVIVAERKVEVPAGIKLEIVPSARQALAYLSAKYYDFPSRKLKLIGVTGTNGKTTITYLVQAILKEAGYRVEVIGTINSPLTTPESADLQAELARMVEEGVSHCVMEVSSHALAQDRVYACDFDIAIFTNLTRDHLDYHGTMENYLAAKRKLFEMLSEDGVAIVNVDDPASKSIIEAVKGEVVPYGLKQAKHELRSTKYSEFDVRTSGVVILEKEMILKINSMEIRSPLVGMHNVYNILAAFQCGLVLGLPLAVIKRGIESVKVVPGRQEEIDCGQPFRVIVDFAHSPDSLQKLLETYRSLVKGKIILVFGCPGERDQGKRPLMGKIAGEMADFVIVTTDDPHGENPEEIAKDIEVGLKEFGESKYKIILERKQAIKEALKAAKAGDLVLLAGRGHEKFQDFSGRKVPIDDKEVAKEVLISLLL